MGLFRSATKNELTAVGSFDYEKLAEVIISSNKELINVIAASISQSISQEFSKLLNSTNLLSEDTTRDTKHNYMVSNVNNLSDKKTADEILATLFGNMPKQHASRLRPFYTYLEQITSAPLSKFHEERVAHLPNRGDSKYPYRKMDSILMVLDPTLVFEEAKKYEFKK
ncbi:hypothetical protein [Virgibacillus pantothenticus]|uniref:hypothetical protein n=1 Tax=Virgibacillus pantothenticus TaxID=1473 RepID=UPI0009853C82|nr:hypothetical protein [Virgibacillus pantothenticus]